jgi:Tfp pilus assembly protein FimT
LPSIAVESTRNQSIAVGVIRRMTLLELILVMAIICTVLAMAAPSLRGFFASRRTHNAAARMLALMKACRSRAISEGRIYRFNLDAEEGVFWMSVRQEGVFRELPSEFGRRFDLPEATTASREDLAPGSPAHVQFHPDGRADRVLIRLTGQGGEVVELTCPSATEFYEIRSPLAEGNE